MPATVRHYRNEDVTVRLTVQNPDRTAYDLTGATCKLVVKTNPEDSDANALFTKTITSTGTASGVIVAPTTGGIADFFILPADTAALPVVDARTPRSAVFAIQVKTGAGKRYTVATGDWEVLRELMGAF